MLPNYLADIKSAGIYRFVWDKSEIPGQQAQTLRLVIGYSEKGPFNTPVYVTSEQEFKQIFGGKSKKLERYGVWFHRMAIEALKGGPILALNIKNFEIGGPTDNIVQFTTFDANQPIAKVNEETGELEPLPMKIKNLYNTDRFWKLEPEHLEDLADDGVLPPTMERPGYITITTTDSKDTSVSIFMRGYEPTGYDVPFKEWYSSVLNGEDLPAYLEGYENNLVSQYFAQLFIFKGKFTPEVAASDKLSKFFNVEGTKVTLKPYIVNAFGEKIDTLTALAGNDASNFVKSYTGILLPDFRNASNMVISLDSLVNGDNYTHKLLMRFNQALLWDGEVKLDQIETTGWSLGPNVGARRNNGRSYPMLSFEDVDPVVYKGELVLNEETEDYEWKYTAPEDQKGLAADYYEYEGLQGTQGEDDYTLVFDDENNSFGKAGIHEGDSISFVTVDNPDTEETNEASNTLAHVVKITESVVEEVPEIPGIPEHKSYNVQFDTKVNPGTKIFKCAGSITATSAYLRPLYLQGYTFGDPKPDSTRQDDKLKWQHNILDSLTNYRGLRLALTNRVDIDYRYLVDTFESFVEPECKAVLANLCKEKDNVFGLLNFPKMSSFSKCKYTSFRNEKNEFLTKYIPMGGNPQKPMARAFSLPSQENGASWVGFFSALALRDGNTGLREEIPSAALVSNNFMEKYTRYFPYTIIAGPNRSVIRETGLIGPDFNFSREDLNELEPFGVNCMVYEPRKGTYINANQTAKQNPVTALSRIHVRELVIYLQDEIEKLMTDYQWDFNTPNLQQRVKDRADVILEQVKNNDGLYAYVNVCDDSNNTDDVVNAEMFVLSTSIEPAQGAGKMIQELTIYRKGGMKSVITEA